MMVATTPTKSLELALTSFAARNKIYQEQEVENRIEGVGISQNPGFFEKPGFLSLVRGWAIAHGFHPGLPARIDVPRLVQGLSDIRLVGLRLAFARLSQKTWQP